MLVKTKRKKKQKQNLWGFPIFTQYRLASPICLTPFNPLSKLILLSPLIACQLSFLHNNLLGHYFPALVGLQGGFIDDFLSHLMCCCCALVQEWREVEIRGLSGPEKTKTSPPPSQYMES